MVKVAFIAYQWSYLIMLLEVKPANCTLMLNPTELCCMEFGSDEGAQDLRDWEGDLHQTTYQSVFEDVVSIYVLSTLV
jgi:hypothetical protein